MITTVHTSEYLHVDLVSLKNGKKLNSRYNHNYYISDCVGSFGDIICEECNDDSAFAYYRIDPETGDETYLGFEFGVSGIFNDGEEIVELDSEIF